MGIKLNDELTCFIVKRWWIVFCAEKFISSRDLRITF